MKFPNVFPKNPNTPLKGRVLGMWDSNGTLDNLINGKNGVTFNDKDRFTEMSGKSIANGENFKVDYGTRPEVLIAIDKDAAFSRNPPKAVNTQELSRGSWIGGEVFHDIEYLQVKLKYMGDSKYHYTRWICDPPIKDVFYVYQNMQKKNWLEENRKIVISGGVVIALILGYTLYKRSKK